MEGFSQSAGEVPASTPGTNGALPMRDGSVTLARVIDAYMARYDGNDPTRAQRLGLWRQRLGHVRLDELDDDAIHVAMAEFASQRGTYYKGRDAAGQRIQAAVSAALSWAQRERITPKGWVNPCRSVPLRREPKGRVRFLTDDERARLLDAARASKWDRLFCSRCCCSLVGVGAARPRACAGRIATSNAARRWWRDPRTATAGCCR